MKIHTGVVATAIIGLIVVAFTLAAFFLLEVERIAVNRWAFAFLLLSQIVLFGGLIGLRSTGENHANLFIRAGVSTALSLYFAATMVSVLFAGAFRDNLNMFILIQLAIIALFSIITISLFACSRRIARRNEIDLKKVGTNELKRGGF